MSGAHPEIGPELRRLAQSILDGIDPALRAAATLTAGAGPGTGKCQQVWCPVCALAALATGDEHPLLTAIADHSIALLQVIRDIVNQAGDMDRASKPTPEPPPDGPPGGGADADAASRTRYQPIPVKLDE